jgi:hypothetical protein
MSVPIEIHLLAHPKRLAMAERDRFRVGLTATNRSQDALDPQLYGTRLFVDGEPSPAFDLAIGNGVMPAAWDLLAPGDSTPVVEWPLGEALFERPGEYQLVLRLEVDGRAATESSTTVVVTD